jgi:hypothetical protein
VVSAQVGDEPSTPLRAAQAARARGWRPIPLDHPHAHGDAVDEDGNPTGCTGKHDRIPCDGERGKHPCGNWGTQSASAPTDGMLKIWFGNDPRNVGIACGPSGLVVLDEDELDALTKLAGELGETLPRTYRVRTRRGWHWYFRPPPDRVVGNRPGALKAHHIDVRGGKGAGGYVVGAGSVHESGHIYVAEDDAAEPAVVPGWIIDLIDAEIEGEPREGWTDDVRFGSREELLAQFTHRLELVRTPGFRYSMFNAARDGWRLVGAGVLDELSMLGQLRDVVMRVWGAPPNAKDRRIVYDEAKAAAEQSPWAVIAEPQEIGDHTDYVVNAEGAPERERAEDELPAPNGDPLPDPEAEPERYAQRLAKDVEWELYRREVRRRADLAGRPTLRRMSAAEFLAAPQPTYLVPGLFYEDSLAVVFGPPGAAKTFFVLDLALHLATGRLWRGETLLRRTRVHYLMAEGQAVNVGRTLAWLTHHRVDPGELDGWFDAFPEPIPLTPEGIQAYLTEAEKDRPGLIVVDTKHAMMEGDENKASDIKVMRDALTELRNRTKACVVLVDHTGIHDESRARGSNSQKAMVATEVRLTVDGAVRTAELTRNTAGAAVGAWSFQLQPVPDAPHPFGTDTPVVPVASARGASEGLELRSSCWGIPRHALPSVVADIGGTVGETACDIFRALLEAQDRDGLTVPQIRGLLSESPREHTRTIVYNAVNKLDELGVMEHALGGKSWLLTPPYAEWRPATQELNEVSDEAG